MANSKLVHLVLLSGGLASFEAARRVVRKYGRRSVRLWFFDTLIEDEDLYRFLADVERALEIRIERFAEGRNPWQVFHDRRFIGNSRVDLCSRILKRELLEKLLLEKYPNKNVALYFGLEWTETHRMEALKPQWESKGYRVAFPLQWRPLLMQQDFEEIIRGYGIKIPRLYELGFAHNNCGGACIKAGIKQWSLLWKRFPDRYKWHESMEENVRALLRKNVAILRDRSNGSTHPLTLRTLRERLEHIQATSDFLQGLDDDSSCSCFVSTDLLR